MLAEANESDETRKRICAGGMLLSWIEPSTAADEVVRRDVQCVKGRDPPTPVASARGGAKRSCEVFSTSAFIDHVFFDSYHSLAL